MAIGMVLRSGYILKEYNKCKYFGVCRDGKNFSYRKDGKRYKYCQTCYKEFIRSKYEDCWSSDDDEYLE